ncbi:hypothetical protein TNCV_2877191 [Trichonephila clavipes]|uniref:Uncharacterized protein n=1 Tax=Trichonephila clavipes TaxID=2585209 RepID=A0A8X7BIY5_TRICX|nr:hypothetical protein TNCV_2877191 [Trichonephila clavipes]
MCPVLNNGEGHSRSPSSLSMVIAVTRVRVARRFVDVSRIVKHSDYHSVLALVLPSLSETTAIFTTLCTPMVDASQRTPSRM